MVELLVEPGVLDSGLGDNESRGGGGRLQRRSFALCSARKEDAAIGQRMMGAGARRNAFFSFV